MADTAYVQTYMIDLCDSCASRLHPVEGADVPEPLCAACGKPAGTGTLLDFSPDPPRRAQEMGVLREVWERFARRYRCPMCNL